MVRAGFRITVSDMAIRTELSLRLPNAPGALAQVCDELRRERVNLLALHLEEGGRLRLVVDNPLHAAAALRANHHQVDDRDVLYTTVPSAPGAVARALSLLAEAGVNVEYAYGGGGEGAAMTLMVVGVEDAQRASALSGW
jgi:hypothetical protein